MNYKIITDEAKLLEFINWLPDLEVHETYYMCLFMRKKYCPDVPWIKSDKGQLKRLTTNKERMFEKIQQLECALGSYKFHGNPVPQESLALYITPNPRDMWKATIKGISALAKLIECSAKNSNPHQEIMSEIQRNPSKNKKYILFDLDWKDEAKLKVCMDTVDNYCDVIETRGGYHMHVHKSKVDKITNKKWYTTIQAMADVAGDNMTPICGTYQGSWTPTFIHRCKED